MTKKTTLNFSDYEKKLLETCILVDSDFESFLRRKIANLAVTFLHNKINNLNVNCDNSQICIKEKTEQPQCAVRTEQPQCAVSKKADLKTVPMKFEDAISKISYRNCKKKFHARMLDFLVSEQMEGKKPTLKELLDAANISKEVRNKNFLCEVGRFLKKAGVKRERVNINNKTQTVYHLQ